MTELARALANDGPALGFGAATTSAVAENICVVVTTTGSTGESKEIHLSRAALLASAAAANKFLNTKIGETWSLLLPLTHIAGVNVLVRSLELGTIPINLLNHEGEFPRADYTAIVPTQLFKALNGDERLLRHLQSVNAVLVGGSALSPELKAKANSAKINIITTYGMSETTGGCVYNEIALPNVRIAIGANSVIRIAGPILASNIKIDSDGWFETNDLGIIENGLLKVLGRADDVIISGGENISLSQVESALTAHFSGVEFAAFATESEKWGEELQVAVVNAPAGFSESVCEILIDKFGKAAKPRAFHSISALPLIGIGKVDRKALVELVMKSELSLE
jgi:O-succinylbenzoic acid--CoA ligase